MSTLLALTFVFTLTAFAARASAHTPSWKGGALTAKAGYQRHALRHHRWWVHHGEGYDAWWHQQAARWTRRGLQRTLEALEVAANPLALVASVGGGGCGGAFDDGTYNFHLQFADGWLCVFPWLDGSKAAQIRAAEIIGSRSSGDPWPNCPDPYDGSGGTWDDTAACEGGGW